MRAVQASHPESSNAVPFRRVAIVFIVLLAIGLALGFVVYRKYVAYGPRAAEHVPADATLFARIDLTHVMLYEPARRSLLPLAEWGARPERKRADELTARGITLGADVRELLLALGPSREDWVLVIGGKLPRGTVTDTLATILEGEQRPSALAAGGVRVLASGAAFAQAADNTFLLASSERRLRSALAARPAESALTQGAGGIVVSGARLGSPWRSLRASWRAGSFVSIAGSAEFDDAEQGSAALRALLARGQRIDPALHAPLGQARLHAQGNVLTFELDLPREAVEALARWVAARTDSIGPAAVR